MEIIVAKHSGFCFGVDKAVKTAFSVQCDGRVFTLGQLIHNAQVTEALRRKGIKPIDDIDELKEMTVSSYGPTAWAGTFMSA